VKLQKIIGQFSLLAAISLVIYVLAQIGLSYRAESAQVLERLWQNDFQNLKVNSALPSYWSNIRIVEKTAAQGDVLAEVWTKSVAPPITVNPDGTYKLEILFLSQVDGPQKRAVIQHHIVDISTGNTVWELGRTYEFN